ncbi:MAG: hypothetical protein IT303_07360 [Dehalococcoidia bacterium]|nr:hypothetical protein [Dehalococcoidia bacterium]
MEIEVSGETAEWLAGLVASGQFTSAEEAVAAAVRGLVPMHDDPAPEPAPDVDAPAARATPSGANDEVDLDHELFAAVRERLRARGPQVF